MQLTGEHRIEDEHGWGTSALWLVYFDSEVGAVST